MNLRVRNVRRGYCEVLANEQSGQRYHTFALVTKDADGLWRWRSGDDDIDFLAQMAHYSDGFRTRGECVADCERWAYRQMVDEAVRRQPTPSVQLNCARNRAICELSSTSLFTEEEMRHLRKLLASYHDDGMDGRIGGIEMSNYYLCDYCANKAGDSFFRANAVKCWKYPDNVPKKVMHDGVEKPTDVCRYYESKEKS